MGGGGGGLRGLRKVGVEYPVEDSRKEDMTGMTGKNVYIYGEIDYSDFRNALREDCYLSDR